MQRNVTAGEKAIASCFPCKVISTLKLGTDNLALEFHLFPKDLSSEWKVPSGELSWWRYFWRSVVFGAGPIHYHNWGPGHVRADYEQNSKTGQIWHQQQLLLEPFHSLWLLLLSGTMGQTEHWFANYKQGVGCLKLTVVFVIGWHSFGSEVKPIKYCHIDITWKNWYGRIKRQCCF